MAQFFVNIISKFYGCYILMDMIITQVLIMSFLFFHKEFCRVEIHQEIRCSNAYFNSWAVCLISIYTSKDFHIKFVRVFKINLVLEVNHLYNGLMGRAVES